MTNSTTAGAGYSGTPLVRKLGIKPGHRIDIVDRPTDWEIPDLPDDAIPVRENEPADIIVMFFREAADLVERLPRLAHRIFPAGALWIAWPRKAAGHVSDISENLLREVGLPLGIVDVKVAAIDNDWSGLKFVWRVEHRNLATPPAFNGSARD